MWEQVYESWVQSNHFVGKDLDSLLGMSDEEKKDSFSCSLEFGTGGLRGKMGFGTNRINRFTVAKAATGLANYILHHQEDGKKLGVAIAYDSRHQSKYFAEVAACALATKGITAYIFRELRPTPLLSFAVRHLNLSGGIVITASHNPPIYNGFKAYGSDGGQFPAKESEELIGFVNEIENELMLEICSRDEAVASGHLIELGVEIERAYVQAIDALRMYSDAELDKRVSVVFTALHGTAATLFPSVMAHNGFQMVYNVEEQCVPDGDFPTVQSPNPEEPSAFEMAIWRAKAVQADIIIACDPDADRLGLAVRTEKGEYQLLTGNQTGALFMNYLIQAKKKQGEDLQDYVLLDTIVTSLFAQKIAQTYGIHNERTLTGFKYIGEKIKQFEKENSYRFLMGYEESYGYLFLDIVRDKDAIQAGLLMVEMAAYYKKQNINLVRELHKLYDKFGYFKESLESVIMVGTDGMAKIDKILGLFQQMKVPNDFGGFELKRIEDYERQVMRFPDGTEEEMCQYPKSRVIKLVLADDTWVCIRPSGTEPKIKFYYGVKGNSMNESEEAILGLKAEISHYIQMI